MSDRLVSPVVASIDNETPARKHAALPFGDNQDVRSDVPESGTEQRTALTSCRRPLGVPSCNGDRAASHTGTVRPPRDSGIYP